MLHETILGYFANPRVVLGVMSGVLSTFAYLPYILDTAKGRTQPDRACWLIWSVLGSIALASQIAEGARVSLWFAVVQVAGTIIVFLQSIRQGSGNYLSRRNSVVLLIAAFGIAVWFVTETAAYALLITISVSLLGGALTVQKAYRNPDSETLTTWAVSLTAALCAVISVGSFDPVILAYPVYLFVLYIGIVGAVVLGRLSGYRNMSGFVWKSRRERAYVMPPKRYPPMQAAR